MEKKKEGYQCNHNAFFDQLVFEIVYREIYELDEVIYCIDLKAIR